MMAVKVAFDQQDLEKLQEEYCGLVDFLEAEYYDFDQSPK